MRKKTYFQYTPPVKTAWDELPMSEKADIMKSCVRNGIISLQDVRTAYNNYAAGRNILEGISDYQANAEEFGNFLAGEGRKDSEEKVVVHQPYYAYDENGRKIDDTLYYNVDVALPEVTVIPDSRKSPAQRNADERFRQRFNRNYAEQQARDYTTRQSIAAQREWENSPQKKALDLGIAAAQGIGMASDVVSPFFGGISVYSGLKGAQALDRATSTNELADYVDAALWLSPMLTVAGKKVYDVAKPAVQRAFAKGTPASEWALGNTTQDMSIFGKSSIPEEVSIIEMPVDKRKTATQRMMDFINSPEYQSRLKKAGMEEDWDAIGNYVEQRVNGENYFPAKEWSILDNNPDKVGSSNISKSAENYGVNIKQGVSDSEFKQSIDHELSHWSTGNLKSERLFNRIFSQTYDVPYDPVIGKIMSYNKTIAPTRSWEDFSKEFIPKGTPEEVVSQWKKQFKYISDVQEIRANAYAMLQEAKRQGLTTEQFVDKYIKNGRVVNNAPEQFENLSYVYKPNDLKKFMKEFLSISAPVTIGLTINKHD